MSNQTWMSGGSGSGVYDPVTTTADGGHPAEADESWLQFKTNGRTYNFGTYRKSGVRAVCDEVRNRSRPRCLLIGFVATALLILLIVVAVVASSGGSKPTAPSLSFEEWENKSTGLSFLPVGSSGQVLLDFSVRDGAEHSYLGYTTTLEKAMDGFKTIHIRNESHVLCGKDNNPPDKVCQQPLDVFGTSCSHPHSYGYPAAQPCVLLFLRLPRNYTIRALVPKDGDLYVKAEKVLGDRFSMDHVGVSCETLPQDRDFLYDNSKAQGPAVEFNPKEGFPSYFFRPRTVDEFVAPAVMIQLRTIKVVLKNPHPVRFTCTAWGKAFDPQGRPVNKDMFTTSFVVLISH